jgi:hypothetical protein
MRIPEEVRRMVAFIGVPERSPNGLETLKFRGTAFFVRLPPETEGVTGGWYHMVTAKHVAEAVQGQDFVIRVNTKDGGSALISARDTHWYFHPDDPCVDVAVCDLYLDDDVDYIDLPSDMFLTNETIEGKDIGAGDEVVITGLLYRREGNKKNLPIVRTGNIALIADSDELIPTEMGNIEAHLVEVRSTGGLSGSPAFVVKCFPFAQTSWEIYFLGIVHGHWSLPTTEANIIEEDRSQPDNPDKGKINTGIAVVTPAQKVLEVLYHPELVEMRQKQEFEKRREYVTPPDAAWEDI